MSTPDPLTVACPDCYAQPGGACVIANHTHGQVTHASRRDSARLAAVEHGTCALCSEPLVLGQRTPTAPVEPWHPDPGHAAACPPLPDPMTSWNAYANAVNAGARAGYPGIENFIPAHGGCACTELCSMGPTCPGGMLARLPGSGCWRTDSAPPLVLDAPLYDCAGQALDPVTDQFVPCAGAR